MKHLKGQIASCLAHNIDWKAIELLGDAVAKFG
jgi:hypothetical protein